VVESRVHSRRLDQTPSRYACILVEVLLRPTPEQFKVLSKTERVAFEIAYHVNDKAMLKAASRAFLATINKNWVARCTKNLLHVQGESVLQNLNPDRGVFLVSNHRSFFDLYVSSTIVFQQTEWARRIYYPVRSDFFYAHPAGPLVNAAMSGFSMFPPVTRKSSQRAFNRYTVDLLAEVAAEPGVMVGFHPEGTRGKGPNPYELLPAQIGTGAIVYKARPIVIPVFSLGLGNDIVKQIRGNFNGTGAPVTVIFGDPIDLGALYVEPDRMRTHKQIADVIHAHLVELGEREKSFRKAIGLPTLPES
jgi:1-acyl-sn-glycerol-3-phosphate acyltransferase